MQDVANPSLEVSANPIGQFEESFGQPSPIYEEPIRVTPQFDIIASIPSSYPN
jgi:hypothetical protein